MDKRNNIENSFSRRFNAANINDQGWNDPSAAIWGKIEKKIYDKPKKRFGFLHFILASLLLMSLLFVGYLYTLNSELKSDLQYASDQYETLNESIDSPNSSPVVDITSVPALSVISSDNSQNEKSTVIIENHTPRKQNLKAVTGLKTNNEIELPKENVFRANTVSSDISSPAVIPSVINKTNRPALEKLKVIEPKVEREIFAFDKLTPELDAMGFVRDKILPRKIELLKVDFPNKSFISFLPIISSGFLRTNGTQETALTELIDREYGNKALGFDMTYTIPIANSFQFSVGLGVESNSYSTEYDITLPYKIEDETIENGSGYIDFEHSLPTAFGNTATALRLNRSSTSGSLEEESVYLDFNTNHNFVALSIPLGVGYDFGGIRSKFNIGFSLRPSYMIHASSSIKSVISHHSDIDAINNKSESSYTDINSLNLSVGLEIGYQYFLTENGGIQMKLRAEDYLFDFYRVEEFSSSIKKVGFTIGYFYSL